MVVAAFTGLDLLTTAVVVIDGSEVVQYANPAAENLFELSSKAFVGHPIGEIFKDDGVLRATINFARANHCNHTENGFRVSVAGRDSLRLSCTASPIGLDSGADIGQNMLLEFRHIEQQLQVAYEERLLDQSQANRELIRNLAHEIKNPLGGIRGAAQLLDRELERPNLHEYTQVIMKEADRLQSLMDRLLTPHRLSQIAPLNIHEVLERVRSLILAEYPSGVEIRRDYDTSLPLLDGDKEQLIQVMLNIVRNAAQVMDGHGQITLRTRIARQITFARRRYRHALRVQISDNGPGIPEDIRDRIFYPLVSGRVGGSGLGLTLAQTFVTQHHGAITFDSGSGYTTFNLLLPVGYVEDGKA